MARRVFNGNISFWTTAKHNKVHVQKVSTKSPSPVTFQKCQRVTLLIGQLFSLMPVIGVFSDSASNVKFVWKSWKCTYSFISLIGQLFITLMCIYQVSEDTTLGGMTTLIFYGTTCVTMLMFFQIARKWPLLVQHISKTEELDPNFDSKLSLKCNITCVIVLFLALVEHVLSLLSALASTVPCDSIHKTYEGFIKHFYPWIFNAVPYSPLLGGVIQFLHFQATFIWNFSDLFVICMSYYLTSRLQQVNKKLLVAQGKYLPEIFWRNTREEYGRAAQIVRKVDDVISGIVFISFANNLFFICLQLFNTLGDGVNGEMLECSGKKRPSALGGYEATVYFAFSLVYLISRSVAVSLIASEVNMASDMPAQVLYDVPSPVYCIEVQRFLDQVNGDVIALSGLQFFCITRGLLLTVAGTIVTYELVMFQFSAPTLSSNSTLAEISTTAASI